ncbi:hypothetical protein F2P81_006056 [Scophthalmus maximus]|uniref:Sec16 Sec23-binding domain-containing protein n=1 Tax=Scophthalmus maximus TaxID=52904 RepID=A0A6A4TH07_SCOMX|nr:hypothetical protein F2P81_006056 [Scophthalmus maximus]
MDHRGRPWPDSGRHSRRTKDRDDKSRHSHQDRDQSYPAPDPRERERHWVHPDAGYRAHYPSPAARQEQYPYNSHQYPYSYERAEPQRPLSRYDQGGDTSQHHLNVRGENPSTENEEVSSYYLGTLESSKTSGLSSSSYELSQYMNGGEHGHSAPQPAHTSDAEHGPVHQASAPLKYSIPHAIVSFGPAGQLIRVTAGFSAQKNVSQLEVHSLEQIVGSDIAEMLMQGSRSDGSRESEATTLIDFSEGATAEEPPQKGDDLLTGNWSSFSSETTGKALQSYTRLLLAGRKKEALESAMSNGLWGHALFLASKMDNRSYTTVLNRFTGQLTASDPLQTLFQLLSGRIPAVATCCGNEQLADWRPHLAVMLSNETGDPAVQQKAIVTMGDTLASRGLLHAAHVCYLTAGVPFGVFTQKAERLVLLSSSHRQPFEYFATNSAIHCTELYEYCQTLRGKCFSIPSFQAFHYCEVVGKAVLGQREPVLVLTGEVVKTGSYGSAETYHPEPEVCALAHEDSKVNSAPGLADLSRDIQSPEPELLYYRVSEDQDVLLNQTQGNPEERTALSSDIAGAPAWPCASPPIPVTVVYAPLVPTVATSQGLSYHNRDSAEVRTASTHCPLSVPPSAAEGAGSYSGTGEMGGRMLEVDIRHQGQNQQGTPQGFECSGQTDEPPKESTKTGWFRGWFNSKPKDDERESSEHRSTAQTELPPSTGFCPPPPPAIISPDTFPPQPSSAGINPFSRKAGSLTPLTTK